MDEPLSHPLRIGLNCYQEMSGLKGTCSDIHCNICFQSVAYQHWILVNFNNRATEEWGQQKGLQ